MLCTVCEIRIYYLLTYTDHTVYGTVCAVSALMMLTVVGVVCTSVYIRCKHKGNVHILALHHPKVFNFCNALPVPLAALMH